LRNAMVDFHEGTVHIIGVNPDVTPSTPHLAVKFNGQFFIGADNGVFSLICDAQPESVTELNMLLDTDVRTFAIRDVFAKAACFLASGGTPEVIGKRVDGIQLKDDFTPSADGNFIRGKVIYVDGFDNAHTNISEQMFKSVGLNRPFDLLLRTTKYKITKVHRSYDAVPVGQAVALFSTSGMIELAINKGAPGSGGGAGQLLGLRPGDPINIAFHD